MSFDWIQSIAIASSMFAFFCAARYKPKANSLFLASVLMPALRNTLSCSGSFNIHTITYSSTSSCVASFCYEITRATSSSLNRPTSPSSSTLRWALTWKASGSFNNAALRANFCATSTRFQCVSVSYESPATIFSITEDSSRRRVHTFL